MEIVSIELKGVRLVDFFNIDQNDDIIIKIQGGISKMEIKIVKSTTSLSGYSLMDGDVTLDINDVTKDGKSLILPENSSGRKFWALSKVEKGNVNVTEKSASQGTEKKSKSSINLEEDMKYLTEEEQELFKKFLAKIEKGKLKEKLEAEKADLLQKLADLEEDDE